MASTLTGLALLGGYSAPDRAVLDIRIQGDEGNAVVTPAGSLNRPKVSKKTGYLQCVGRMVPSAGTVPFRSAPQAWALAFTPTRRTPDKGPCFVWNW
jgi:hypothetical protein